MQRPANSLVTIARLVRADLTKLSRYWVIAVGYSAMLIVAIPGAMLFHWGEQFISVTSESGYAFAFSVMMDVTLRWGGDWDGDRDFKDQRFIDLPHFELVVT